MLIDSTKFSVKYLYKISASIISAGAILSSLYEVGYLSAIDKRLIGLISPSDVIFNAVQWVPISILFIAPLYFTTSIHISQTKSTVEEIKHSRNVNFYDFIMRISPYVILCVFVVLYFGMIDGGGGFGLPFIFVIGVAFSWMIIDYFGFFRNNIDVSVLSFCFVLPLWAFISYFSGHLSGEGSISLAKNDSYADGASTVNGVVSGKIIKIINNGAILYGYNGVIYFVNNSGNYFAIKK